MATVTATTRRALLKAAPALGLTVAVPAVAAVAEDPILPLYEQWKAARHENRALAAAGRPEEESDAAFEVEDVAFWQMTKMTPTSMAGIAALMHVLWSIHGPNYARASDRYAAELALPECMLMSAIWRGAGGATSDPTDEEEDGLGLL